MKKKLIILALTVLSIFTFAGCISANANNTASQTTTKLIRLPLDDTPAEKDTDNIQNEDCPKNHPRKHPHVNNKMPKVVPDFRFKAPEISTRDNRAKIPHSDLNLFKTMIHKNTEQ